MPALDSSLLRFDPKAPALDLVTPDVMPDVTGGHGLYDYDPCQSLVIQSSGDYIAVVHNAFVTDQNGQPWIYYHGVDKNHQLLSHVISGDRVNRRILLRSRIDFADGWPVATN